MSLIQWAEMPNNKPPLHTLICFNKLRPLPPVSDWFPDPSDFKKAQMCYGAFMSFYLKHPSVNRLVTDQAELLYLKGRYTSILRLARKEKLQVARHELLAAISDNAKHLVILHGKMRLSFSEIYASEFNWRFVIPGTKRKFSFFANWQISLGILPGNEMASTCITEVISSKTLRQISEYHTQQTELALIRELPHRTV